MNSAALARVVLLTPLGRGAIATVLVEGPQATAIVEECLLTASGRPLGGYPIERVVVGHWGGPTGEEVVVCRRSPDRIELHCHGGPLAVSAVMEALIGAGCRAVSWAAWGRRNETDGLRAEAREALARAATLPAAAILLDQHAGALRRGIERILAELADADLQAATASLQAILRHSRLGLHLVEPWRVVIAGAPNVGKTTLLNALVGYRRGIVHDQPGTTRDVVTAATALGGWPVELADTAGLQASTDAVEAAGIELANELLHSADAIVLVFDTSRMSSPIDCRLEESWPAAIRVANKCDLPRARAVGSSSLCVSGLTGEGIELLTRSIADHIAPDPPPRGAPIPFRQRHVTSLKNALAAAVGGDSGTASRLLGELLDDDGGQGR
jgi:tRNA modification GTPase